MTSAPITPLRGQPIPPLAQQLNRVYGTGLCPPDWSLLQGALAVADKIREQCAPAEQESIITIAAATGTRSEALNRITEWASRLTGASGAALALQHRDTLVCVARSGNTAPELGASLDNNVGLSGQCARTGEIQVSLDTESDQRTDAAAARNLGVQSLVIVPIGSNPTLGILAVFSAMPHHFSGEDVLALLFLAGLANKTIGREPDRLHSENSQVAMLVPAASDGGVPMKVFDGTKILMPREAERSPQESRLRVPAFVLEVLLGILIGAVGGVLVYRAKQTHARPPSASAPGPTAPTAVVSNKPAVRHVDYQSINGNLQVTISLDQMVAYDAHRLVGPDRVYIDLHDSRLAPEIAGKTLFASIGGLSTIRLAQTQPDTVRIVLDLDKRFDYVVNQQTDPAALVVQLAPPTSAKAKGRTKKGNVTR